MDKSFYIKNNIIDVENVININDADVRSARKLKTKALTNEDLNDLRDEDFASYMGNGLNTCANRPEGVDAFSLQVFRIGQNHIEQVLMASRYNKVYMRYYDGNWHPWVLAFDQDSKITLDDLDPTLKHPFEYVNIFDTNITNLDELKDTGYYILNDYIYKEGSAVTVYNIPTICIVLHVNTVIDNIRQFMYDFSEGCFKYRIKTESGDKVTDWTDWVFIKMNGAYIKDESIPQKKLFYNVYGNGENALDKLVKRGFYIIDNNVSAHQNNPTFMVVHVHKESIMQTWYDNDGSVKIRVSRDNGVTFSKWKKYGEDKIIELEERMTQLSDKVDNLIWTGTQDEYNAITTKEDGKLYCIIEED